MKPPLFWAPPEKIQNGRVTFPAQESHHFQEVLRLRTGDPVRVFDGTGRIYGCILRSSAEGVYGEVVGEEPAPQRLSTIVLGIGLLGTERFDWVVEKATELQVARIVPLVTQYSQSSGRPARLERWRRIALAACKQSGNLIIPKVEEPMPFQQFLREATEDNRWILQEHGGRLPVEKGAEGSAALLVGPEGGWHSDEIQLAAAAGFVGITLVGTTLRAETGALAGLILIRRWMDW
ncbi:MAG: RsmE family RNA methyltransferase [Acidobacteriota bacterium]